MFDFGGRAFDQPLELEVDTKLGYLTSFPFIHLNTHTVTIASRFSHLERLTVRSSGTIHFNDFGSLLFHDSDCNCQMESITFVQSGVLEIATLT